MSCSCTSLLERDFIAVLENLMEYGGKSEDDRSIRQDFPFYGGEYQHSGSPRDWFAVDKFAATDDSSDLMEESLPAANENHYNHEHVRHLSDYSLYHQDHQQQQKHNAEQQTLGVGNGGLICNIEREHMFDKVVTPSDVGKLNRLVIPKQHAEKYFPDLDSSSNEKGLLLNFEDLTGKEWQFRYSYWNSSQSYVMTKGWSRFVKEKKLDAGDIVSFQRGVDEADQKHRLFIDWRRRHITTLSVEMSPFNSQLYRSAGGIIIPSWSPLLLRPPPNRVHPDINFHIQNPNSYYYSGYGNVNYMGQVVTNNASIVYLTSPESIGMVQGREGGGGIRERIPMVFESVPVVQGKRVAAGVAKKLRLFGVNMECPVSSDTSTSDEFEILSSSLAIPLSSPTAHHVNQYPSSSPLLLPPIIRMHNSALISNKGKTSLDLDI